MKKIIFLVILVFGFVAMASAADTMTATWEQANVEHVNGWRLYQSGTQGGPYEMLVEIPKGEPAEGEYSAAVPKEGLTGERFFVMRAFNEVDESENSNEVRFVLGPGAPFIIRITLE